MRRRPDTWVREFREAARRLGPDDSERLHRLRVSARHLMALLDAVEGNPEPARRALKALFKKTNPWRDYDVAAAWLERAAGMKAPRTPPRDFERLRRVECARVIREVGRLVPAAGRTTPRGSHHLRKLLKHALEKPDAPRRQHRVRLAVKELRYTLEAAAPRHPLLASLRRAQRVLGTRHDLEVAWEILALKSGPSRLQDVWRRDARKQDRRSRRRMKDLMARLAT